METVATHIGTRPLALLLSALSTASMLYIGLYQTRRIERMWCPVFGNGCEVVADSAIAHPFGIPDGYIAAAIYGLVFLLLLIPDQRNGIRITLVALTGFATLAGIIGIRDMYRLGDFCFFCVITTVMSPVLFWAVWKTK